MKPYTTIRRFYAVIGFLHIIAYIIFAIMLLIGASRAPETPVTPQYLPVTTQQSPTYQPQVHQNQPVTPTYQPVTDQYDTPTLMETPVQTHFPMPKSKASSPESKEECMRLTVIVGMSHGRYVDNYDACVEDVTNYMRENDLDYLL